MLKSLFLIFCLFLVSCSLNLKSENVDRLDLQKSIDFGMNFLEKNQLESGEFATYQCEDKLMHNCSYQSSTFITGIILYSIRGLHKENASLVRNNAGRFLKNESIDGLWSFYSHKSSEKLPPDIDDTAISSLALKINNISFKQDIRKIEGNINSHGLFYTWFDSDKKNVDCVVNANVLAYLGENNETAKVCDYLNEIINSSGEKDCSSYYPDEFSLYYSISKAYENGVKCFFKSKDDITQRIHKKINGANDLEKCLAATTLINFGYGDKDVREIIIKIREIQSEDGSWQMNAFFTDLTPNYYGSKELTTAICIETLNKYQNLISTKAPEK